MKPSWRGLDFHTHLLPGVDDGIATFDEAYACIADLQKLGFQGAVLTPHIYKGVFDNTTKNIIREFDAFSKKLFETNVNFRLYLAAEYYADEHFLELISSDDILSIPVHDERWVLVESSFLQPSPFIGACLSALTAKGYRPVIAHIERYLFVLTDQAYWLRQFSDLGALLQGDLGSLSGQHGKAIQRFAIALLKRGIVKLWGTDLHKRHQINDFVVPGIYSIGHQKLLILRGHDIGPPTKISL